MTKTHAIATVLTTVVVIVCVLEKRSDAACPDPGKAWLRVRADPTFDAASRVVGQLRTELSSRGVAVCLATSANDGAQAPLAEVSMALDRDALALRVEDRATDKRLERTVSLRGIPNDARPLAMAVAIDELVRASWIEALLERAANDPAPPPPAPPPVVVAIAKDTIATRVAAPVVENDHRPAAPTAERPDTVAASASPARAALGVMLAGEHATGGLSWGGFDARASYGEALSVGARLGYRLGAIATANHGDVASNAALAGISLSYALLGRPRATSLALFASGDVARVTFAGRAAAGATATSDAGWALLAGGGVRASWVLSGQWALATELSASAPLRSVAALDDGARVVALSGAVLGLAIGIDAGL